LCFTQNLTRLNLSQLSNKEFIQSNNLENFSILATSAEVGVAYIDQNEVRRFNQEKGIQLIRINSNNLPILKSNLSFANTVEMIVVNITKPGFNIQSIECSKLKQFKNLKYIYFVFQTNQIENKQIPSLNCTADNITQYYTCQRPI